MEKTLGGDRLGSGKKLRVDMHGFERSTHNMGYIWRSTASAGTLIPFLNEVTQPGDDWEIDLECNVKTHPTIGPLFGSFKIQLDVFKADIRLYQGKLHNNLTGIGLKMNTIKLPTLILSATPIATIADLDNQQINPSCVLNYLGIRGIGYHTTGSVLPRNFNGVPILMLWDTYKNYYSNKQEEIGAVIHTIQTAVNETILTFLVDGVALPQNNPTTPIILAPGDVTIITYTFPGPAPALEDIIVSTSVGEQTMLQLSTGASDDGAGTWTIPMNYTDYGAITLNFWRYRSASDINELAPTVATFPLENLDLMRELILAHAVNATAFDIIGQGLTPYSWLNGNNGGFPFKMMTQEGLPVKTYQSDQFNNWLSTDWLDGVGGINEITAVSTAGGSFKIEDLNMAMKVYKMLNRVAVSGGTYDDWQDANYDHGGSKMKETPVYVGGLQKELVFQEVVSNAEAEGDGGNQPLGTLAGKGVMGNKTKGGKVSVKVDAPGYIQGLFSLTPRIDYSQGNKWDTGLETLDDIHKPGLDEIGFQELITEKMAWWTTEWTGAIWQQKSAGKQPAWIDYMTNVNRCYGNFAIENNEMFMTLNRRYEPDTVLPATIKDLTTYIDPVKYNHIFADTRIDAQNFWVQIGIDAKVRRKMSAKIMPNL